MGGSPAACVACSRKRRRPFAAAPEASATPSIATRSNGGWSRSA